MQKSRKPASLREIASTHFDNHAELARLELRGEGVDVSRFGGRTITHGIKAMDHKRLLRLREMETK